MSPVQMSLSPVQTSHILNTRSTNEQRHTRNRERDTARPNNIHAIQQCPLYKWIVSPNQMSHIKWAIYHHEPEYKWAIYHIHIYKWAIYKTCMIRMIHVTPEIEIEIRRASLLHIRVMSHVQMSHVNHTHESCHPHEWAMYHTHVQWVICKIHMLRMSHVTPEIESEIHCAPRLHIPSSNVTHTNESCSPYKLAIYHIHIYKWAIHKTHMLRMSHVTPEIEIEIQRAPRLHIRLSHVPPYEWVTPSIQMSNIPCTHLQMSHMQKIHDTNESCHTRDRKRGTARPSTERRRICFPCRAAGRICCCLCVAVYCSELQ